VAHLAGALLIAAMVVLGGNIMRELFVKEADFKHLFVWTAETFLAGMLGGIGYALCVFG
jgi:hypothetical protein